MKTTIGNFTYRLVENRVEIIHWVQNTLYGTKNEFENLTQLNDTCFNDKEVYYVIAYLEIAEKPNVVSVGMRAFELDGQENEDFKLLMRYAYQYAVKAWMKQNK